MHDESLYYYHRWMVVPNLLRGKPNVTEEAAGVFSLDFLSPEYCRKLVAECNASNRWCKAQPGSHFSNLYVQLHTLPWGHYLFSVYLTLISRFIAPIVQSCWDFQIEGYYPPSFNKFCRGIGVDPHIDNNRTNGINVTLVISLNDNFEGGRTIFPDLKCKVSPHVGKATFFPAGVTHRHGADKVARGIRYTLSGWIA